MNVNASHVRDRNTAHRRRVRRAAPMIGVLSIALLASACSSGSSGKSLAAPSGHGDMVAYAHCMRSHGVSNFPDPMAGGQVALPTGLDPKSPQYEKAAVACRSIAPNGATQQHFTPPMAQLLQFSECMRSHGITKFPDPSNTGRLSLPDGVSPNSPQFKSAQAACAKYQPKPQAPPK
jgi:hypothetical protein